MARGRLSLHLVLGVGALALTAQPPPHGPTAIALSAGSSPFPALTRLGIRPQDEVVERRDATSWTFQRADGSFLSVLHTELVNYRDANDINSERVLENVLGRSAGREAYARVAGFDLATASKDRMENRGVDYDVAEKIVNHRDPHRIGRGSEFANYNAERAGEENRDRRRGWRRPARHLFRNPGRQQ